MNCKGLVLGLVIVLICLGAPRSTLGVEGLLADATCGSAGTLVTNLADRQLDFDLSATLAPNIDCDLTLFWTDASGHQLSIGLGGASTSRGVTTSLPAGGRISWTAAPGGGTGDAMLWQLQGFHSTGSVDSRSSIAAAYTSAGGAPCGSSGILYSNATPQPVGFDLSVYNLTGTVPLGCSVTVSWTDASGNSRSILADLNIGQAVLGTSLPPGGAVSWRSTPGATNVQFGWNLQRADFAVATKGGQ